MFSEGGQNRGKNCWEGRRKSPIEAKKSLCGSQIESTVNYKDLKNWDNQEAPPCKARPQWKRTRADQPTVRKNGTRSGGELATSKNDPAELIIDPSRSDKPDLPYSETNRAVIKVGTREGGVAPNSNAPPRTGQDASTAVRKGGRERRGWRMRGNPQGGG